MFQFGRNRRRPQRQNEREDFKHDGYHRHREREEQAVARTDYAEEMAGLLIFTGGVAKVLSTVLGTFSGNVTTLRMRVRLKVLADALHDFERIAVLIRVGDTQALVPLCDARYRVLKAAQDNWAKTGSDDGIPDCTSLFRHGSEVLLLIRGKARAQVQSVEAQAQPVSDAVAVPLEMAVYEG
ncbi:hypothetical protein [Paraburkholderia youngii]|uniref:hypothetical protein n=1 Tax=Paraburkholderia youngii TaxID=2782701 RepID=UPI003D25D944